MLIRTYEPRDREALERIHRGQGFGYVLPDLDHPIFLTKLVLHSDGEIVEKGLIAAAALKLTAEAYLLIDPKVGTPQDRLLSIMALHEAVRQDAYRKGLHDVHAFLPPRVSKGFGRRLRALGWQREPWEPWCRTTEGATWPEA